LSRESTASKLLPLGADEDSLDGLNPQFVSLDEIHKYKSRAMIDVLETATGARAQPIIYKITTAGDDLNSACGDEHNYACGVLDGSLVDETYFAFIAHADPGDDWTSADTARKANPNYGVSINPGDLAAKVVKARGMPAAKATYQQKHLNLWVNVSQPWLDMDGWRKGQSAPGAWSLAELAGRPCLVGVDLSAKLDLTALVALFPPLADEPWRVVPYVWTPADTMAERAHRDRAPYPQWRDEGYLRTTPGTRVDHQVIRDALAELRSVVDIRAAGFDPWHADQLIVQLTQTDGFATDQVVEVSQTYKGMSSGCKSLQAAVLAGQVDVRGDPVVTWAAGNAVVQTDGKDNIYPLKKRSRGRIDPLMALCVAWSIALKATEPAIPQIHV
jgi:phage terminase large subunit-like protein